MLYLIKKQQGIGWLRYTVTNLSPYCFYLKDFKKKNTYGKILAAAENKLEIATLANKLTLKLESLSDEKLYNTLKKLSEFIDAE